MFLGFGYFPVSLSGRGTILWCCQNGHQAWPPAGWLLTVLLSFSAASAFEIPAFSEKSGPLLLDVVVFQRLNGPAGTYCHRCFLVVRLSTPSLFLSLLLFSSLSLSLCLRLLRPLTLPAAGDIREGAGKERCRAPAADGRRRRGGFSSSEHQPRLPRRGQRRARRHAEGHRHARRRAGVKSRQPMPIYILY